jgi:hypothetical protein
MLDSFKRAVRSGYRIRRPQDRRLGEAYFLRFGGWLHDIFPAVVATSMTARWSLNILRANFTGRAGKATAGWSHSLDPNDAWMR